MLLGLTACYYGPIEELDLNQVPRIVNSTAPNGTPLVLSRPSQKVYVAVQDEVPEALSFEWTLSADGFIRDAETFPSGGSQITLTDDSGLDGQILKCQVRDEEHAVEIWWPLEVL